MILSLFFGFYSYFVKGSFYNSRLVTMNPLTYYRFYIILFNLLGLAILLNLKKANVNVLNQIQESELEYHINFISFSLIFVFILSFLPLLTIIQRTSYMFIYFCMILNIYYGTNIFLRFSRNLRIHPKLFFVTLLLTLSLLLNSLIMYKFFYRSNYDSNNQIRKMERRKEIY